MGEDITDRFRFGNKGRRPGLFLLVVALIIVVAVCIWLFMRRQPAATLLPEVRVAMADTSRLEVYGEYEGNIRPRQFVEIHARVDGYLQKMLFKEGSYVNKGQTLFVIDPKVSQAQVDRARAQLNKALALKKKAERDLSRIRPLYDQNAASQVDLDNATATLECANADVAICKADLLQAELTLSYTRVVSPITGYISESKADIGALVGPSVGKSLLATIVRSDSIIVDFSMTALDYLKSKERNVDISGDCDDDGAGKVPSYVTITLADESEYPYKGFVEFAEPQADSKDGRFLVRAWLPNPQRELLPGEATKVRVLLDVLSGKMTIPAVALQKNSEGTFVYVIDSEGMVNHRHVKAGPRVNDRVVIESGLTPGEKVAIDSFDILSEVEKVREKEK